MRLALTPRAAQDLDDIFDYSAEVWGIERTILYIRALQAAMERLLLFPELGRSIHEVRPGVRLLPVESHLIIYRLRGEAIDVVRILHQRMDIERHI
jgi:toxin ParE1/3/4